MNSIQEINRINQRELDLGLTGSASWHHQYSQSAYVHVGGLSYEMTEGDVLAVFSQFGEIMDINMPRDQDSGKPRGFAFLMYEDQRSTVLAVDNMNGALVLGRMLKVDHVHKYEQPGKRDEEGKYQKPDEPTYNAMPPELSGSDDSSDSESEDDTKIDADDPMAAFLRAERKKNKPKKSGNDKEEKRRRKEERRLKREEKERRRLVKQLRAKEKGKGVKREDYDGEGRRGEGRDAGRRDDRGVRRERTRSPKLEVEDIPLRSAERSDGGRGESAERSDGGRGESGRRSERNGSEARDRTRRDERDRRGVSPPRRDRRDVDDGRRDRSPARERNGKDERRERYPDERYDRRRDPREEYDRRDRR